MPRLPEVAKRNDWKTLDLPVQHATVPVDRAFSAREIQLIKLGFIPQDMDERWFACYDDDRLYLHRSWTGFCIYVIRFEKRDEKYVAYELLVNRDHRQYAQTDDSYDAKLAFELVDHILLAPRDLRPRFELLVGDRKVR